MRLTILVWVMGILSLKIVILICFPFLTVPPASEQPNKGSINEEEDDKLGRRGDYVPCLDVEKNFETNPT